MYRRDDCGRLGAARTWVAAWFADGLLWRHDLATGHDDVVARPRIATAQWMQVDTDGTIYFPEDDQLWKWTTAQRVTLVAKLPQPIRDAVLLDDGRLFALTKDGAGYTIELASGTVASRLASGTRLNSVISSRQLAIALERRDTMLAIDASTGIRWPLAQTSTTVGAPDVSVDGQRAFAYIGDTRLEWRLDVPLTQDDTARWIETLTNARAPTGPTVLTWE